MLCCLVCRLETLLMQTVLIARRCFAGSRATELGEPKGCNDIPAVADRVCWRNWMKPRCAVSFLNAPRFLVLKQICGRSDDCGELSKKSTGSGCVWGLFSGK